MCLSWAVYAAKRGLAKAPFAGHVHGMEFVSYMQTALDEARAAAGRGEVRRHALLGPPRTATSAQDLSEGAQATGRRSPAHDGFDPPRLRKMKADAAARECAGGEKCECHTEKGSRNDIAGIVGADHDPAEGDPEPGNHDQPAPGREDQCQCSGERGNRRGMAGGKARIAVSLERQEVEGNRSGFFIKFRTRTAQSPFQEKRKDPGDRDRIKREGRIGEHRAYPHAKPERQLRSVQHQQGETDKPGRPQDPMRLAEIGEGGEISDVKVINILRFNEELPQLVINSATGSGVQLRPVFGIIPEDRLSPDGRQVGIVSVIDCI